MIYIAACDDDPLQLEIINTLVHNAFAPAVSGPDPAYRLHLYTDADECLSAINSGIVFDILIIDVVLPKVSGINVAHEVSLRCPEAKIIFISHNPDYFQDVYAVRHVYFLQKPLEPELFAAALRKAMPDEASPTIVISNKESDVFIKPGEIVFIESLKKILYIHTDNRLITLRAKLDDLEGKLPKRGFARCHKSYIVNIRKIQKIENKNITLSNGRIIPISRARADTVRDSVGEYLLWEAMRH